MGTLTRYLKMQLLKGVYRLTPPKQLEFQAIAEDFSQAEIEYILNYTSNIIKLTSNGRSYYFREAKKRYKTLKECVLFNVDIFFREIMPKYKLEAEIKEHLRKGKNLRRLVYMGGKNERGGNLYRYLISGDERFVGLPLARNQEDKDLERRLIFFLYGEINAFICNTGVKAGDLQTFSAVRTLGTQRLAEILGLGNMIVPSKYVKISVNGNIKYGILSEKACGSSRVDVPCEERVRHVTPHLLRALTNLNILDVLTFDNDHRIGNYFVVENGSGEYEGIASFDNDGMTVFALSSRINKKNPIKCSGILRKNGEINRAHIDKGTASVLLALKREELNELSAYLSGVQIYCVWLRLKKLKEAIKKTLKNRRDFLLEENEWSDLHIRQELCGDYGKTYLKSFLFDGYFEKGLHDFDSL